MESVVGCHRNTHLSEQRSDMSESELFKVDELATVYSERLSDLSWFMKNLNEYISRKANKEYIKRTGTL